MEGSRSHSDIQAGEELTPSRVSEEGQVPADFLGAEPEPTLGRRALSRRPERRKTPVALTDSPGSPALLCGSDTPPVPAPRLVALRFCFAFEI